jgi:hypothetical protein
MKSKYSKEEKKEHVKLYKKNIFFYSPYLIALGLIIIELSAYLYKNGKIFMSLYDLVLYLLLPIILIILEYMDMIDYFLGILIYGLYFYLTSNIFIICLDYITKTHNYIASSGLILIILGFILCFIFYGYVKAKILNKSKEEVQADKMKEQYSNLKEGTYIIGSYIHGFKDVEVNLPCITYFEDNELKLIFAKDTERLIKNISIKLIKNITYRNSNRLVQNKGAYLSHTPLYFFMTGDTEYTFRHSSLAVDVVADTKVDVIMCWEIEIEYMEDGKEKDFLLDVYENPEQFVSNCKKLIE